MAITVSLVGLFGFYLASTGASGPVNDLSAAVIDAISKL